MNAPASVTITPIRVADLLAESERMPVNVHLIDHPDARVLVDTGMTGCTRWWPTWSLASSR
jgi:N-acyl homoserine lactone hydrolase